MKKARGGFVNGLTNFSGLLIKIKVSKADETYNLLLFNKSIQSFWRINQAFDDFICQLKILNDFVLSNFLDIMSSR